MWRAYGRIERLNKALEYRKINPKKINLYDLKDTLIKRGITDSRLCDIYNMMLTHLEPKGCKMYHCEYHGVDGFCNCCKNLVPSKCKKHREFLKRCKNRANKAADKLLEVIGDHEKFIDYKWDSWYFFKIGEQEKFAFVNKWSSRLQFDVWNEIKNRKKTIIKGDN